MTTATTIQSQVSEFADNDGTENLSDLFDNLYAQHGLEVLSSAMEGSDYQEYYWEWEEGLSARQARSAQYEQELQKVEEDWKSSLHCLYQNSPESFEPKARTLRYNGGKSVGGWNGHIQTRNGADSVVTETANTLTHEGVEYHAKDFLSYEVFKKAWLNSPRKEVASPRVFDSSADCVVK
jgi:hypothetical protein